MKSQVFLGEKFLCFHRNQIVLVTLATNEHSSNNNPK